MKIERAATDTDRRFLEKFFRANIADLSRGCIPSLDVEERQRNQFGLHVYALLLIRGEGRHIAGGIHSHSPTTFARLAHDAAAAEIVRDWRLLEHLAVDEGFRATGIGKALVDAAETQHRAEGAQDWVLQVDGHDAAAIPFYVSVGFVALEGAASIPNREMARIAVHHDRRRGTWMHKKF